MTLGLMTSWGGRPPSPTTRLRIVLSRSGAGRDPAARRSEAIAPRPSQATIPHDPAANPIRAIAAAGVIPAGSFAGPGEPGDPAVTCPSGQHNEAIPVRAAGTSSRAGAL